MKDTEKSLSDRTKKRGYHGSPARIEALWAHTDKDIRDGWHFLHLALISTILFIVPIFFIDMCGGDETRVAGIAAEMILDGDWLTPKLNGVPFLEYPPLFYNAVAMNFRIFGFTPFAAKLPAALSALAGVLMFYAMMRILRRSKIESFAGAFMLATELQYLTNAYDCRVDMMLTAFCILVWTGFALMEFSGKGIARRIAGMAMIAAGIAGGVLTKNLTGLAITLPGLGCVLLFRDLAERRFSFAAYCRLAGATLIGMLPYALYLWLMYRKSGMDAVETIFLYNNFGRFSGSVADHGAPWWGYLERIPEYFPPYLPLVFGGIFLQIKALKERRSAYGILTLTLLAIPFLILSVASNKRQVYLLPLAAPAAMLAASTLPYVVYLGRKLFGRKTMLLVCRRSGIILYAAAAMFALIAGAVSRNNSVQDTFAPVFAEAEAQLRAVPGRRLVLVQPGERHSGAVVFYHRAAVPEFQKWDELRPGDIALSPLNRKKPLELPKGYSVVRRFEDAKIVLVSREK